MYSIFQFYWWHLLTEPLMIMKLHMHRFWMFLVCINRCKFISSPSKLDLSVLSFSRRLFDMLDVYKPWLPQSSIYQNQIRFRYPMSHFITTFHKQHFSGKKKISFMAPHSKLGSNLQQNSSVLLENFPEILFACIMVDT